MPRLHDVAEAALDAVAARLRPGVHAAGAGRRPPGVIEDAGFTTVDDLVHGFGGGYLPPVIGSRSRAIRPTPDMTLEAGMTVVVQPNVATPTGGSACRPASCCWSPTTAPSACTPSREDW